MGTTPSHRLKLQRAEKHLTDIDSLLVGVQDRRPYPVRESFDAQRKQWTYRPCFDEVHPPETFPIVLGDFLFNVRSALDHLVVAIAPQKYKDRVSFPIFTRDPLAIDEATGDYLDAQAANAWHSRTKGLPSDCIAVLKELQPHERGRHLSKPPADDPVAVLSALQNADKHRNLVTVITGLRDPQAWIDGVAAEIEFPPVESPALQNHAVLYASPTQVKVEIEGTAVIGIGRPNEARDFHAVVPALLDYIVNAALARLEPFLP